MLLFDTCIYLYFPFSLLYHSFIFLLIIIYIDMFLHVLYISLLTE